jgi:PPOX class probable F420-dependent enzyme
VDANSKQETIGGLLIRRPSVLDAGVCRLLEAQNVVTVCTLARDGTIHAQPVWVDTDGHDVLLNSVPDRAWVRNLNRNPRVTCNVVNLQNPYEFVEIRGVASAATREGADEHIHRLAQKYLGLDEYPWLSPDQPRVLVRVRPERIVHMYPGDDELQR